MITHPAKFRISPAAPQGEWILTAACGCSLCNGRGTLRELSTGEEQTCDCPWEGASEEVIVMIEEGTAWSVDPSPSFVAFMEMLADTPSDPDPEERSLSSAHLEEQNSARYEDRHGSWADYDGQDDGPDTDEDGQPGDDFYGSDCAFDEYRMDQGWDDDGGDD